MSLRRTAAIGALLLGFGGLTLAVVIAVQEFPRGLIALACVALAVVAAWYGILRRGPARIAGLAVGALGVGAALLLLASDRLLEQVLVIAALVLSSTCARAAFGVRAHLPQVPAPLRPVLFFNPKSGGGKAERFSVAAEARARGIESIELGPGRDLERLVRDAVAGGADGLAMAGDGSQAVVAALAAELDLPYACVPAGTRNRFALDLGVDRDDVVGALDAFVEGGERRVDLADVNGRVFVNNRGSGGRLPQRPWREWTAPAFEVDADHPVPAGIDREAATLQPPLRFHIRPGVLRVRIARRHPGASPSAMLPESLGGTVRALARIVAGHDPAAGNNQPTQSTTRES
jgi:Diacylglycerol kinase catalytic domain